MQDQPVYCQPISLIELSLDLKKLFYIQSRVYLFGIFSFLYTQHIYNLVSRNLQKHLLYARSVSKCSIKSSNYQ